MIIELMLIKFVFLMIALLVLIWIGFLINHHSCERTERMRKEHARIIAEHRRRQLNQWDWY